MRFTIRELTLLPVLLLMCVPLVSAAEFLGLALFPQFTTNGSGIRTWFLDRGFSVDFVCGHITFFAMQIPTILILTAGTIAMFAFRLRLFDIAALTLLATFPLIDSLNLGWAYLKTQPLPFVAVGLISCVYILARLRLSALPPTRVRVRFATAFSAMIVIPSTLIWQQLG